MPELPEVETTVRGLAVLLPGQCIETVDRLDWPRTLGGLPPDSFVAACMGRRVVGVRRRGKVIVVELDAEVTLVIHRKMTGNLLYFPVGSDPGRHTHVRWRFGSGAELHFSDPRKFGRVWLCLGAAALAERLADLGPEPLEEGFDADWLARALARRGSAVKSALLDQGVVAGLGNIYADEALFFAGIHPRRAANGLAQAEYQRLVEAIRRVLEEAIGEGGTSFRDHVGALGESGSYWERRRVYGRAGQPCPTCGRPIERLVLGQRSAHFCGVCQPLDVTA